MSESMLNNILELHTMIRQFSNSLQKHKGNSRHEQAYKVINTGQGDVDVDNPDAQRLWEDLFNNNPVDYVAAHHLAIIHHARAYDLEEDRSDAAFDEWQKALKYWAIVMSSDDFRDRLMDKGRSLGDRFSEADFAEFCQNIPRYLLSVHSDLARSYVHNLSKRSRRHMQIILGSDFPQELKEDIRRTLYMELIAGVEDCRQLGEYEQAAEKIRLYLRIDPDYTLGLQHIISIFNDWSNFMWARFRGSDAQEDVRMISIAIQRARPFVEKLGTQSSANEAHIAELLAEHYFMAGIVPHEEALFVHGKLTGGQATPEACDEAIEHYDSAISDYKSSIRYDRGRRAMKETERLFHAYTGKADVMLWRGYLSTMDRDSFVKKALNALSKAEELKPLGRDELLIKAQCLSALGRTSEARKIQSEISKL